MANSESGGYSQGSTTANPPSYGFGGIHACQKSQNGGCLPHPRRDMLAALDAMTGTSNWAIVRNKANSRRGQMIVNCGPDKELSGEVRADAPARNKANCRGRGSFVPARPHRHGKKPAARARDTRGCRAKQSQFLLGTGDRQLRSRQKSCQEKQGLVHPCETKPIAGVGATSSRRGPMGTARNRRREPESPGAAMRNKANSQGGQAKANCCTGRKLWEKSATGSPVETKPIYRSGSVCPNPCHEAQESLLNPGWNVVK